MIFLRNNQHRRFFFQYFSDKAHTILYISILQKRSFIYPVEGEGSNSIMSLLLTRRGKLFRVVYTEAVFPSRGLSSPVISLTVFVLNTAKHGRYNLSKA